MKKFKPEEFSNDFIDIIESLADALEVDPVVFIENIVIKRLADDRAADDVYGNLKIMPEFMKHDGKVQRGRDLYKTLYNIERRRLELEYIERLQPVPWEALQDHEKELLKRYGHAPKAKEKRKQKDLLFKEYEAELKEQGLKPFYTEQELKEKE